MRLISGYAATRRLFSVFLTRARFTVLCARYNGGSARQQLALFLWSATLSVNVKRVLIVQPSLQPPGGGNAVAAWVVQALRDCCDVSLLTWRPVDCAPINRFFGTSLKSGDFKTYLFDQRLLRLLDALPLPLTLLKMCLLFRCCRKHLQSHDYEVLISTINETDFGRPGIQYIHFPWDYEPRPDADLRWYHGVSLFLWVYRRSCRWISGIRDQGLCENLTLVNSEYIGAKIRARYGIKPVTLFPPVPGDFPDVPWEDREDGFVCIGRISPEKELEKVIEIIAAVRERGHNVKFHLIGTQDNPSYTRCILKKVSRYQSWAHVHLDLSRDELAELLAKNRYGIHGMIGEHFGIAVAELILAGCVTFVPDQGGPVEIVGRKLDLMYASRQEAVEKINRVVSDTDLQVALHREMLGRRSLFTSHRFVERLRQIVLDFGDGNTAEV